MTLPPSEEKPNHPPTLRQFGGWVLMASGGLIAATSGLCTGAFLFNNLSFKGLASADAALLALATLFGGLPFATGIRLFLTGRRIGREKPARQTVD